MNRMGLQFLLHTGDDVDDHDDSRDTWETAPLPPDAQNPEHPATALPFVTMPTLSSNIPSLAEQEAWHYQIVGDSELYGLVEIGRQNERTLRAGMKRHIEQFLSRCSQLDPSIRIKVDQEVDLRSHFLKTNYKDTPSFKAYRNYLNPTISSHLFPLPPVSVGSGSTTTFYTAPLAATSAAQVPSTPSRSSGACLVDLTMYGSQHTERLPKIKSINGTIELKNLKEDAVEGTPLETPPFSPGSTASAMHKTATKELSGKLQSYVKEGAAQTIWYGALEQEMMVDGDGPLPTVIIAYQVNQYFLRILLLGESILVESEVAHVETTVNVETWLEDFKDGRKFPHHLSTLQGAKALSDFLLVSRELILQSMSNQDAIPDAINATTGTTNLFHAFTHIERTPEAVLEAGLGHATGIRAERKANKLQTESDQPSESRNRTSTGGTDGGPSGSGGGSGGKSMVNPQGGLLGQGHRGGDAGSGVGSTGFSGASFKSCAGSGGTGQEWLPPSPAGSMDRTLGRDTQKFQHGHHRLPLSLPPSPPLSPAPSQICPSNDDELGSATSAAEYYHKKPLKVQLQTLRSRGVRCLPIHEFERFLQQILPSVGTGPGRPM